MGSWRKENPNGTFLQAELAFKSWFIPVTAQQDAIKHLKTIRQGKFGIKAHLKSFQQALLLLPEAIDEAWKLDILNLCQVSGPCR